MCNLSPFNWKTMASNSGQFPLDEYLQTVTQHQIQTKTYIREIRKLIKSVTKKKKKKKLPVNKLCAAKCIATRRLQRAACPHFGPLYMWLCTNPCSVSQEPDSGISLFQPEAPRVCQQRHTFRGWWWQLITVSNAWINPPQPREVCIFDLHGPNEMQYRYLLMQ